MKGSNSSRICSAVFQGRPVSLRQPVILHFEGLVFGLMLPVLYLKLGYFDYISPFSVCCNYSSILYCALTVLWKCACSCRRLALILKWELMLYCLHCPTLNKVVLLLLLLLLLLYPTSTVSEDMVWTNNYIYRFMGVWLLIHDVNNTPVACEG